MATYRDIESYVRRKHGRSVKSCWIAHVKELNGLPLRKAWNRRSPAVRAEPCPPSVRDLIEDAMRHLGMMP